MKKAKRNSIRKTPRFLLIATPVVALSALYFTFAYDASVEDSGELKAERLLEVNALPLQRLENAYLERRYLGTVTAARRSDVGFERGGKIVQLYFEEGQRVKAGQALAQLDLESLHAKRRELKAGLLEAEASQALALGTYERAQRAGERNAISTQQLDEARRTHDIRVAAVQQIIARIDSLEVDIGKSTLQAPFSGTISKRYIDEGVVISTGVPIYRILEDSELEIRVGLSIEAANQLTSGTEIDIAFEGGRHSVRVDQVLPERDDRTRTVEVLLRGVPSGLGLRDGDLVDVFAKEASGYSSYLVPRSALTESSRGLWSVYVARAASDSETTLVQRRDVEVIHSLAMDVLIDGALSPDEWVVTDGLHRLSPSQRVRVAAYSSPEAPIADASQERPRERPES
ncbi:MAG: efflux RND transporter periplasmic adaptor subunit [Verrucomicrobiota bacterium]